MRKRKQTNKKNSSMHGWQTTLSYLREARNEIYFIIALFALSALIGFVLQDRLTFLDSLLHELVTKTETLPAPELIAFIFWNNAKIAFAGLFAGVILGVFPVMNALSNGIVLGYVFARVAAISGLSDFWRILPHGIFELPAIFISLGLGLRLGLFIFSKQPLKELKLRFKYSLKVFFFVILPLLLIAALIEGILIALYR